MTATYHHEPAPYFARVPTAWEEEFADALQAIFVGGTTDLEGIVSALNRSRLRPPAGGGWTVDGFQRLLRELGTPS